MRTFQYFYGIVRRCSRNRITVRLRRSGSRSSHSQTVSTLHPQRSKSAMFRASRLMLPSSLCAQYSARADGRLDRPQPSCWCQKQPFTKITHLRFGNTRSGVPGSSLRCRRYRNPSECTSRRAASSGVVFFALTKAIKRLLRSGVSLSMAVDVQ